MSPDMIYQWLALGREYSPNDITNFRLQARTGYTKLLYSFFDEMQRFGISTQCNKLREGARGSKFQILAWPEDARSHQNKDPEAVKARDIAAYCDHQLAAFLPDAFAYAANVFLYGIAGLAVHWQPMGDAEGRDQILALEEIPARRFKLDPTTQKWMLLEQPWDLIGLPVDRLVRDGKLLFFEIDKGQPLDQRGLLWQCITPWAVMQYGYRWWAKYVEVCGIPIFTATYNEKNRRGEEIAQAAVKRMGASFKTAIPDTVKFDFVEGIGGVGGNDSHSKLVEFCLRYFDQLILGHSHVSGAQVGTGSRTSGEKADQNYVRLCNSRNLTLAGDFRRQLIRSLVVRNYGEEAARKFLPEVVATAIQTPDYEAESRTVLNLVQAGAKNIPEVQALERCGYRVAEPEEAKLGLPQQAAKPAFGKAPEAPALPEADAQDEPAPDEKTMAAFAATGEQNDGPAFLSDQEMTLMARIKRPYRTLFTKQRAEALSLLMRGLRDGTRG